MSTLASPTRSESDAAATLDCEPFFLPGTEGGCLLLHGFTATPQEMRFLGDELNLAGYTAAGIRLAGHGTSLEDFARTTRHDWFTSARDALLELHAQASPVAVVGQSMGALLALQLAAEYPADVSAVVLLAPAIRLSSAWLHWVRPLLPLVNGGSRSITKRRSDIADPQAREQRRCYTRIPLSAFHELLQLQRSVHPLLSRVRQPVMIIHSIEDHTCSLAGVEILRRKLPAPPQVLLVENSFHVLSVDRERDRVAATVSAFLTAAFLQR